MQMFHTGNMNSSNPGYTECNMIKAMNRNKEWLEAEIKKTSEMFEFIMSYSDEFPSWST